MIERTQPFGETPFDFGPFEFYPTQRVLMRAGEAIRIGSRAREILLVLLESGGTIVKKKTLFARVWPDVVVEDVTLRVHITELRKILSEGHNGPRYIENVNGIGYRFRAAVIRPAVPPCRYCGHAITNAPALHRRDESPQNLQRKAPPPRARASAGFVPTPVICLPPGDAANNS